MKRGGGSAIVTNAQEVIDDIIEKIRCAKASGKNKIFVGSYTKTLSAISKTLNFNVECVLRDDYKKYKTYNLTFPYEKTAYNDFCYKYSFGEIFFIVNKTKEYYFERYINSTSFVSQVYDIQEYIKSESISEALKVLYRSSYCVFEKLTSFERKQLIKGLSEQWTLPECDENMVLNLLRASAENADDARDVLSYVFSSKSKLFKSLNSGMSDFNGYGSNSEFMKLLVKLFTQAYKDDKERGFYISSIGNKLISASFYTDEWQEELKGSSIHLYNGVYNINCAKHFYDTQNKYWATEYGVFQLTPLTMITIHFSRSVSGFNVGDEVTMPMFYYAYLLNINLSEYKAEVIDNVMYCVSILNAAYAVRGGIKALMTLSGVLATADVLLGFINKVIEANEKELAVWFEKNDLEYAHFSRTWNNFYKIYQAATSLNSIASKLNDGKTIQLLYDGLGIINMYMSESSGFTKEQIKDCKTLREQLKTIMNDDVIY